MNELDEDQIRILMKGTPFNGCYTKDDLDYIPDGCTVYNLNGQSHWTALYRKNNHFFYFDSFGTVPPQLIEDLIERCVAQPLRGSRVGAKPHGLYVYNDKDIQALNSSSCGFYCCAFLKWMYDSKQKYKAFEDFKNLFDNQYQKNEIILNELLKLSKPTLKRSD
jgi:Ulp1 family protease